MSSRPRATVDDRPSATPEDRPGFVDGSAVSPAEHDPSEPPPPLSLQRDHFVASVGAAHRVVALVVAVGLAGIAAWFAAIAWRELVDGLAGRFPMNLKVIFGVLVAIGCLLLVIRRMWLTARHGPGMKPDADEIAETESRAFLEAVERHDRLLEQAKERGEG